MAKLCSFSFNREDFSKNYFSQITCYPLSSQLLPTFRLVIDLDPSTEPSRFPFPPSTSHSPFPLSDFSLPLAVQSEESIIL